MGRLNTLCRNGLVSALILIAGCLATAHTSTSEPGESIRKAAKLNARAMKYHERRCLDDASALYRKILALDPPVEPSPDQFAAVLRYAPRLYTVAGEFFPLADVAAIVHPDKPVIGYHLFWGDDIDYPDDNDPIDHEVVWIEYDPATEAVVRVSTYFHEDILQGDAAVRDANANSGRAWIGVEWGKHGSLPWDAAGIKSGQPNQELRKNWEILHTKGTRAPDHPLARGWPQRFVGGFDAYRAFSVLVDPSHLLNAKHMIKVGRWANAILDQHFLPYNFSPKQEWPWRGLPF